MRLAPVLLAIALSAGCSKQETSTPAKSAAPAKAAPVALTRSITLPAVRLATDMPREALTLTEGGDDELAEGPPSFDVLPDGGFAIADPLRERIVFYDAAGKYKSDLLLSTAVQRLRVLPGNALSVVLAHSNERLIYEQDGGGNFKAPRAATASDPDLDTADQGVARLEGPNSAVVHPTASGNEAAPIPVRYSAIGENMVSVRRLGQDARGRTFVAMETAFPGERVDVHKLVRLYSPRGEALAEITDIPVDYYTHPVDEFRIHEGSLYQLMPKASEVRINVWDTSGK